MNTLKTDISLLVKIEFLKLSALNDLPIDFVLLKRLWISWFLRLRLCGRSRNQEFMITITITITIVNNETKESESSEL